MEDEIKKSFPDAQISSKYGDRGTFKIEADGEIVFDKNTFERPRFPVDGEVARAIKTKLFE